jgi:uncharacterized protein (TIGR02145 family)
MRYIYLLLLAVLFTSCAKEFRNPYDPATPSDIWMPKAFKLDTLGINALRLSWNQEEQHIDGFAIQKSTNGQLKEILLPLDSLRYTDTQAVDTSSDEVCPELTYKVMARAGNNRSLDIGTASGIRMPLSTPAVAGTDILVTDTSTTVQLNAQEANAGERGQWTVVSGTGGSFSNLNAHNSNFTGSPCNDYILRWTIKGCAETYDEMSVKFQTTTTLANAGDSILTSGSQVTLAGNTPAAGEIGTWTVVSWPGGSFSNINDPNAVFTGSPCTTYTLLWSILGACPNSSTSSEYLVVSFNGLTTTANAGPDQTITNNSTQVTLDANAPAAGENGTWSIISGVGGSFENINSHNTIFNYTIGQSYVLSWSISFCNNISSDQVNMLFPLFTEGNGVIDIDGNNYTSKFIGTQEWMSENLKTTRYCNGELIPNITDNSEWIGLTSGAWSYFNNASSNDVIYGKLYNWYAVNDIRNICPCGWHLPTEAEWSILTNYLGGNQVAGGKMKTIGTSIWQSPNTGATNISGFSGLPGGYRSNIGLFNAQGIYSYYWNYSDSVLNTASSIYLLYSTSNSNQTTSDKKSGLSVRCIKD